MLKPVKLKCPECAYTWEYCYWQWVWKAPFHWLLWDNQFKCIRDYRNTKCPSCRKKSWIAKQK